MCFFSYKSMKRLHLSLNDDDSYDDVFVSNYGRRTAMIDIISIDNRIRTRTISTQSSLLSKGREVRKISLKSLKSKIPNTFLVIEHFSLSESELTQFIT